MIIFYCNKNVWEFKKNNILLLLLLILVYISTLKLQYKYLWMLNFFIFKSLTAELLFWQKTLQSIFLLLLFINASQYYFGKMIVACSETCKACERMCDFGFICIDGA